MNTEVFDAEPALMRKILTVAELNRAVASLLERNFPLVWVSGEISNLTRAASGHWYFSLKDRDAQVRCVMFRNRNQLLDWAPREGDHVEARALVSLYAPRGDFQINVEHLRRAGAGSLYEAFLQLKQKLQAEGLFDPERKRTLPVFPKAIGIVTSLQAAALRDVLTTLARRAPHVRIVLYPTPVQGADAPTKIAAVITLASERAERQHETDVLLVVRGGGSIEDLWAFNDETVARAISACSIPVVSGVGHETDFTIADFVADLRAPTPTAAAEMASPNGPELRRRIHTHAEDLLRAMARLMGDAEQKLDEGQRRLKSPSQRWQDANKELARLMQRLMRARVTQSLAAEAALKQAREDLYRCRPRSDLLKNALIALRDRNRQLISQVCTNQQAALDMRAARLDLLNPMSALERGYSITTDELGQIVRDAGQLAVGGRLQVHFVQGRVSVEVLEVDADRPT